MSFELDMYSGALAHYGSRCPQLSIRISSAFTLSTSDVISQEEFTVWEWLVKLVMA